MRTIIFAALMSAPLLGHTHPGHESASFFHGLASGFTHPLLGLDHLLAMLAMGCLAARFSRAQALGLIAGFLGLLATGFLFAHWSQHTVSAAAVETAISVSLIASAVILGAGKLLQKSAALNMISSLALIAFALAHGHAHGTEVPMQSALAGFGMGFLAASLLILVSAYKLTQLLNTRRIAAA